MTNKKESPNYRKMKSQPYMNWKISAGIFNTMCLLLLLSFGACDKIGQLTDKSSALAKEQKKNPNYVCDMLSNKIHSISFMMKVNNLDKERIKGETLDAYSASDFQMIWDEKNTSQLLETLYNAQEHGLDSRNYQPELIDTLHQQIYKQNKFSGEQLLLNQMDLDLMMTASALSFMADLSTGRYKHKWDIPKSDKDMSHELIMALGKSDFSEAIGGMVGQSKAYKALVKELNRYKEVAKNGGLANVQGSSLSLNKSTKTSKQLAKHLTQTGDYTESNPDGKFTPALKTALKQYQKRHALSQTGSLSQKTLKKLNTPVKDWINLLSLNVDRYRWLPDEMGEKYVFVNIPAYHAELIENGETILDSRVVVGETITPTNVFARDMTHLVFSPIWNIPTSIANEEILKWLHYNPSLLYVGDVTAYYKGKKIEDIHAVDWKEAEKNWRDYSFKQKPTNQNALGDVKFMFPNKYAIYLHDTPAKEYFSESYRALSAGCVRVGKPAELAEYLLRDKGWTLSKVKSAMNGTRERRVNLSKAVPVYLYYLTAWVDKNGLLNFRPDVYKHDKKQLKMVQEAV